MRTVQLVDFGVSGILQSVYKNDLAFDIVDDLKEERDLFRLIERGLMLMKELLDNSKRCFSSFKTAAASLFLEWK